LAPRGILGVDIDLLLTPAALLRSVGSLRYRPLARPAMPGNAYTRRQYSITAPRGVYRVIGVHALHRRRVRQNSKFYRRARA
jgi:hypothetical protein